MRDLEDLLKQGTKLTEVQKNRIVESIKKAERLRDEMTVGKYDALKKFFWDNYDYPHYSLDGKFVVFLAGYFLGKQESK